MIRPKSIGSEPSSPDAQSKRFKEAARDLGCNEDEARFNAALGKIARVKPKELECSDQQEISDPDTRQSVTTDSTARRKSRSR